MKTLAVVYLITALAALGLCVLSFTAGVTLEEAHKKERAEYNYWKNLDGNLP